MIQYAHIFPLPPVFEDMHLTFALISPLTFLLFFSQTSPWNSTTASSDNKILRRQSKKKSETKKKQKQQKTTTTKEWKKKGIILFNGEQFNGGYFWTGPTRHSITVLASTCKRDGCFCHRFARISLYMSSVVFFSSPLSVVNGTLKIVNTGYEFVFKEYIFWELNKCHYSHLLLETSSLQNWFELCQKFGENQRGNGGWRKLPKASAQLLYFYKVYISFFLHRFF